MWPVGREGSVEVLGPMEGWGGESCPLASQLDSLLCLSSQRRQGRDRGDCGRSRAREGPHPLSSVHLAGLIRSGHSFLPMLCRLLGLRSGHPRSQLQGWAAGSRRMLQSFTVRSLGGQSEGAQLAAPKSKGWADSPPPLHMAWAKADAA